MDFSPLRKSFKSHGSYKHGRRVSSGEGGGSSTIIDLHSFNSEEQPILFHEEDSGGTVSDNDYLSRRLTSAAQASPDDSRTREIIVMVDTRDSDQDSTPPRGGRVQREFSFDISQPTARDVQQPHSAADDSPSRRASKFLKQRNSEGNISLKIEDLKLRSPSSYSTFPQESPNSTSAKASREIRVSFEPSSFSGGGNSEVESVRRRYKDLTEGNNKNEGMRDPEVLRCTSNASFRRQASGLARVKTRSRLLDPPEEFERMSVRKSGPFMSGMLGRVVEDEEEDPLGIDDLPDEFKKSKINTFTVLQWVGLIIILGSLICTLAIHRLKAMKLVDLQLWKWEVLVLVLICGRLVSGWGIRILVFFIERNFMLRKRVLYFVYGLRKGVQNCLWLGLVLFSWQSLFDKKVNQRTSGKSEHFLKYVTKVLNCFLVGSIIWFFKTLLVKVLASSFHVSTYFDRIQESLFYQYVIETLSGPPLIEIIRNEEEEERIVSEVRKLQNAGAMMPPDLRAAAFPQGHRSRRQGDQSDAFSQKSLRAGKSFKFSRQLSKKRESCRDDGITLVHLHKLNTKNVSAWNMKRLIKIVRYGRLLTLDEQIAGNQVCEDESGTEIRNEHQAKAAARKIFYNVAGESSKYIYLEDLMRFMRDDEAIKTMSLFEGASESGKISKGALKNWVVNAFRERRALALTLNDTKTAVNKLHQLVNGVVVVIIIAVWLVILEIANSKFFVFVGSQIVVASFIFGNTVKTLFECIIFLFVVHPFDVGDRCEVDAIQMVVEEMNILTTVFLRADNQKIVYPNSVLFTKPIGNFYRSPDMGDAIEFFVHIATPLEKIATMKQRIVSCIESRKDHWYPSPLVILKEQEDLTKLRVAVWLRHRINHQDMGEKWGRRALLLEEMVRIFKELDIQFRLHPVDVNLRTIPPNFATFPARP